MAITLGTLLLVSTLGALVVYFAASLYLGAGWPKVPDAQHTVSVDVGHRHRQVVYLTEVEAARYGWVRAAYLVAASAMGVVSVVAITAGWVRKWRRRTGR